VQPFIENGRTLSSVRVIAESLEANVTWYDKSQLIKLEKGDNTVIMQIGNEDMYVNGEKIKMDTKPIIKKSRSYFPARFVAEGLGSTVLWNEEYNVVFID
jgi:UDP-N-acetylglucosamine transferase subunit ALG13